MGETKQNKGEGDNEIFQIQHQVHINIDRAPSCDEEDNFAVT